MTPGDLADLLRNRRDALGWTQTESARSSGVAYWTLVHWESGERMSHYSEFLSYLEFLGIELRLVPLARFGKDTSDD